VGILDPDPQGEARRETNPVERAVDAWESIHAGSVLRQHRPAEPDDRAPKAPAGLRLEIQVDWRAGRDVAQLGLAEVRHHVPGSGVDEGEDLDATPGVRAVRD